MQLTLPWPTQRRVDDYFEAPWDQDDIPAYGGTIGTKAPNAVRLAGHNINGTRLGLTARPQDGSEEIDAMRSLGIDIMGLVETNTNWSHVARNTLAAMVRLAFGNNGNSVASSAPSTAKSYLPGGTAMVARGKVAGRVLKRVPDAQGRFSYMSFRGKRDTGIIVITVYRVCQKRGSKVGPDTAYMQQYHAQRRDGTLHPDPRNRLLKDLTSLINEWQGKGFTPVLMGDFNADMDDNVFSDFVAEHDLIDVVDEMNDGTPPAYIRSRAPSTRLHPLPSPSQTSHH